MGEYRFSAKFRKTKDCNKCPKYEKCRNSWRGSIETESICMTFSSPEERTKHLHGTLAEVDMALFQNAAKAMHTKQIPYTEEELEHKKNLDEI